jgi:hypothetical protein
MDAAFAQNPDVYYIGGDLAYDNGLPACYYTWDTFLRYFEQATPSQLIPIFSTVGNHDVGMNAMGGATVTLDNYGPLYMFYLPQHLGSDNVSVPALNERRTYYYHLIGNTAHITLDSGYITTFADQVEWLNQTLANLTSLGYATFISYHNPTYPACFSEYYDMFGAMTMAQQEWVPLFDQYNVTAVFENHVHVFKRTYPLTNGTVNNETGIIYFGDGNIGVMSSDCEYNGNINGDIIANAQKVNHIWVMTFDDIYANSTAYQAGSIPVEDPTSLLLKFAAVGPSQNEL